MYNDTQPCPYCHTPMHADWVDVGVGSVQCGPYHCENCGASEIGPELQDWYYKDRDGNIIYTQSKRKYYPWAKKKYHAKDDFRKSVLKYNAPVTEEELKTGFYRKQLSPYANTVNGQLVDHVTAKEMYRIGLLDEKNI